MDKMKMESVDIRQKNIDKIAELFPGTITEKIDEKESTSEKKVYKKAINFDMLRQLLSEEEIAGDEAYEFTWVGKKRAIIEANTPVRKTLRPCMEESKNWNSTENLYIEGDNLDVLKLLQESYLNKVQFIYIDPPYNTGSDSFIYTDKYVMDRDIYEEAVGLFDEEGNRTFRENNSSNPRFHSDWCSMMYSRMVLARNLLSDNGVIFISIDDNELENLKKICEEIFGNSNFVANIVWKHTQQSKNDELHFSRQYNHTLVFSKNKLSLKRFYFERTEDDNKNYRNPDDDPKGLWRSGDVRSPSYRKTLCYNIVAPNGNIITPPENGWRWSEDSLKEKISSGEIKFKDDYSGIIRKIYLCDQSGRTPENLWEGQRFGTTRQAASLIKQLFDGKQVFDTPKPYELIKAMLEIAADKNATVLDFFSGSASTAHAVMKLNFESNSKLKYMLVQIPELCDDNSEAYKSGFLTISDIGKERIRRAGEKILFENPDAKNLDIGFRVFKVDDSNMKDVYYAAGDYNQNILDMIESNIKEDRTDLDLLFSCILEWGMPLSLPYVEEDIDGVKIHNVADGDLIACFEENINEEVIKKIASREQKPLRVVFRDRSFVNSPAKINVEEIFKLLSPNTKIKVL